MPKKYEKKGICPDELEFNILLANILPLDVEMPDILLFVRTQNEFIKEQISRRKAEVKQCFGATMASLTALTLFYDVALENARPNTKITLRNVLRKCLRSFPNDFFLNLRAFAQLDNLPLQELKTTPHTNIDKLIVTYDLIRHIRQGMIEFIFRLESEREGLYRTGGYFPFTIPAMIGKDESGKFFVSGLAGLIGKFDVSRIRLCPMCSYIYWAKRLDSKTCGKQTCIDKFQTRKKKAGKNNDTL